ncbi:PTS sugar transporter subunit IIC [Vagococcus zengguangii]|uniref:PTS sugar transporter subunit IIC n=1 Tax=Vagococcus zengguangii TaxID=2571750 RepID=UPI0011097F85|nr:PTS transporter subunit EIIC [Vagococcus zengguangii]TLG78364.1 PTS sugar transporter subunit IIC [Vagococcus zengguangii]
MKINAEKFQEPLLKIAQKVDNNNVLQAIKNAFVSSIPFTVVGSFSNLIRMQIDAFFGDTGWGQVVSKVFANINQATLGMVALLIVFSTAYNYAKMLQHKDPEANINPLLATLLAFAAYFVMVPNNVNFSDSSAEVIQGFANNFFGYEGMFTALIVGLIAVFMYSVLAKKKIAIRLPGNVPPNVFDSFFSLIPVSIVLIVFSVLRVIIEAFDFNSLMALISQFFVQPLTTVGTGLPAIIVVILLQQILWFLGLHGFNIVWGVVSALWLPIFLENVAKFAETQSFADISIAPNTMTNVYAMIGGSGSTFGLILAILLFTPKHYTGKEVAKLSFIPGLFGINEPIIFGFPIVLNPIMFIPFVLVPVINAVIAFVVTKLGWVVPLVVLNSGNEPIFISTWILGAFKLSPVILTAVLVVLDTLLYAPFVRMNMKAQEESLIS